MTPPPPALGLHPRQWLTGGHRNTVWLCDGPNGPVVAKSTRRTEAQLRWLAPLHQAARVAGFLVPDLQDREGCLLHHGWTVEPFVEGRQANLTDLRDLDPQLRAFYAACPHLPQRPGFFSLPDLIRQDRSGDIDLTALPRDLVTRLRTAWLHFGTANARAIHGDFGPANLIITPDGPCLIDWDESRVDLPFLDEVHLGTLSDPAKTAHLALEIASSWHTEPAHARQLLRGSCFFGHGLT